MKFPNFPAAPSKPHAPASSPERASPPVTRITRILAYRRFWILALIIFFADQGTKQWIDSRLPLNSYGPTGITIIPGFFNLVHVGNTGAAWSMFSGQGTMLALLAITALVSMFFWRRHLALRQPPVQIAFGLLCGGIVGNLVDRLLHGHVIDFLDLHFGDYIYPTFNVADSAICVGVFWYVIWSLRQPAPAHD